MGTRAGLLAAFAFLSMALMQPAAAAPAPLTAEGVAWQDAETGMALLVVQAMEPSAGFSLVAPTVHVHAVATDAYVRSPADGFAYTPAWTYEESDLSRAALRLESGRAGAFLFLLPSAAAVTLDCGAAAPAGGSLQAPSQTEQPNPNPEIGLGDALQVVPCGPVLVCGSFTVVLWERDVTGSSAEGPVHLESGQLARPGEPDARPFLGRAQQLYLTATGGCLSFDGADGAGAGGVELFATDVRLSSAGSLALRGASGALPGLDAPVDGDLALTGRLDADLARQGPGLGVALAGTVSHAEVDGRPVQVASTAATAALPTLPGWAMAAGLAALLGAAAAAALWLRANRPEALARRAERAWLAKEWGRVLHLTARRLRRDEDPRMRILRAKALLALADLPQALAQAGLALLLLPDGPTKADAALVACRASSRLGRDAEALAWLGEVYAQDGPTAERALRHPEVARLTTARDPGYT